MMNTIFGHLMKFIFNNMVRVVACGYRRKLKNLF
jgi:hypothetical protein